MNKNGISLILFSFLLCACQQQQKKTDYPLFSEQKEPDKGEKAVIQGKIRNLQVYPHVRDIKLILPDFSLMGEEHLLPIDSSGSFRFEVYPVVPREFSLTPIQDRLLIAPGDSLYIEHDFADFMHTRITGRGAEVNNQIVQFRNNYLGRFNFDFQNSYHDFRKLCDQQLNDTQEKLKLFQAEHNTTELFDRWAEKQVKIDYFTALMFYPFQYYLRTSEAFTERDAYYSFIPQLEETIDRTIIMTDYYNLVERLNMLKLRGTDPMPKASDVPFSPKESIHLLYKSTDNPFLAQFTVASYLSVETRANSTQTIDVEEEELQTMINDSFLRAMLQKEYNRVKNYVANPRIFSDAVMENNRTEITGAAVLPGDSVNVMKRLVEVNSGKALYVDVWAPWCHPCLTEMPYSQELYDHFEGEPLTFVYLCMGGSREQWQDVIASYALSGLHIYLSESEWLDLMKRFHIKGIPHYLLFNTEGVMIDFGGHLRPGNPETKAAIERALQT